MSDVLSLAAETLREQALQQIRNNLRPGQQNMADWQGGPLAVSAVPGSGKSTGMAGAAAITIAREQLNSRRQLVVVTFTRSAAASIKSKIRKHLRNLGLPQSGFMVQTLHGLALNIATRHPELSGLSLDTATVISPNRTHQLLRASVEQWIVNYPAHYQLLLEGAGFDGEETERLRRQSVLRTEILPALAYTVIHEAKSSGLLPQDLAEIAESQRDDYRILKVATGLYKFYQQALRSRSLIDYDDMILGALKVLEDVGARRLWQNQVFAVFEDEAQDSTPLQTRLLEILASQESADSLPQQNLIRVGDPNQAINSTFTPADPIYFREFCELCQQQNRLATMDQAGRSATILMEAANFALEWVNSQWRKPKSQASFIVEPPFRLQAIRPVGEDDPQPNANPEPEGQGLELYSPRDIYQAVELIGQRIKGLFEQNPDSNAAVLVRTNDQGSFVKQELERLYGNEIELYEVAESDRQSHVPREILSLLQFIERPHSPDYLKTALEVLVKRRVIPAQDLNALAALPEQFMYPDPLASPVKDTVLQARKFCRSFLRAKLELPPYQLISFLALSLNYNQGELATADKLAERLTQQMEGNLSLSATLGILAEIVNSERFEPVEVESMDDSPYTRTRQLTIITMHKAKGLDWDYVFLPFLHDTTIPGDLWVPPQGKFLGEFTLAEVARAQIRARLHGKPLPSVAEAWEQAKGLKMAEEFRLLYVAMTRAKRLLWMSAEQKAPFSWNASVLKRRPSLEEKKPCPVFPALKRQFPESAVIATSVIP